ncbi:MAG: PglZ domain-containing protein [Bacteroidales bacterium]|nr:PglZ domain-containing protein [Bacteroidales bacterium]
MDEFVGKIIDCLTTKNRRMSIVRNPDGFLLRDDTKQVLGENGLVLLPVKSGIELRVRYELMDKFSSNKICYIIDEIDSILPDIKTQLYEAPPFAISRLLPACNEMEILRAKINFKTASHIYNKKITYNLSGDETRSLVLTFEQIYGKDPQVIINDLKSIPLNWENVETIERISNIILKEIKRGAYTEIEDAIQHLNKDFQNFIDKRYFSFINSSPIQKPKLVHKILPHLAHKHKNNDKIVLLIIDGMSYWQYLILDKELKGIGIETTKEITFAYLPSITKLSRQAIFRGAVPSLNYNQSHKEERKLWIDYWTNLQSNKKMQDFEIGYSHGNYQINNSNIYRLAIVDVSLDEKMHSSHNNKDLFVLTNNWAEEVSLHIKELYQSGYTIYITTDHGNIHANPWRSLDIEEKTYLYEKESKGKRHLIYNKTEYLEDFLQKNQEIKDDLLVHDTWAVWRNANNFSNTDNITHGGSHFLEVIIPFITIENK